MLLTTHYLEEAEALCGEIAMIREGRIIVEGTVPEIMNRFGAARLEDAYLAAMQENREARGQTPPGVSPPPGSDPLGGQSL